MIRLSIVSNARKPPLWLKGGFKMTDFDYFAVFAGVVIGNIIYDLLFRKK